MVSIKLRTLASVVVFAIAGISPASAVTVYQTAPIDVRGSYSCVGTSSVFSCTGGVSGSTEPISIFLNVLVQDGTFISGNLGSPDGQSSVIMFTATLDPDGTITGTWNITDMTTDSVYMNKVLTGRFTSDAVEIEMTADFGVAEVFVCQYRLSLSSEGSILTWLEPDTASTTALPPPRALTIEPFPAAGAKRTVSLDGNALNPWAHSRQGERESSPRSGDPTGYNVYRSTSSDVQTTPENLFTSVPATTTTVPAPNGTSGSFFVVTATYDTGESGPSNEVSGGVDAATVNTMKVTTKIKATGTGFSSHVQVFVDGIPFTMSAKVKNGIKVTQKGTLVTGQTLAQYITHGKTVAISFRNENGGIATKVYTKP